MTRLTTRLAVAVALMASAQSATALSLTSPFRAVASAFEGLTGSKGDNAIRFRSHTRHKDAEDTNTLQPLRLATPAPSQTMMGNSVSSLGSVIVRGGVAAPSAEGITAAPPPPVTALVTALSVPVTSVAAVLASEKVESNADDTKIASTPLPAGGLLLGFAGLALVGARRMARR